MLSVKKKLKLRATTSNVEKSTNGENQSSQNLYAEQNLRHLSSLATHNHERTIYACIRNEKLPLANKTSVCIMIWHIERQVKSTRRHDHS